LKELLVKLGAPVVLILLTELLDIFFLPAPGTWLPGVGDGFRYFAALAGAAVAHRTTDPKAKAAAILRPIVLVICSGFGYQYLIQHPPTEAEQTLWAILMAITFVLAYFFVGFLVSAVVAAIWPNPKP
jgi:hypothetical protein